MAEQKNDTNEITKADYIRLSKEVADNLSRSIERFESRLNRLSANDSEFIEVAKLFVSTIDHVASYMQYERGSISKSLGEAVEPMTLICEQNVEQTKLLGDQLSGITKTQASMVEQLTIAVSSMSGVQRDVQYTRKTVEESKQKMEKISEGLTEIKVNHGSRITSVEASQKANETIMQNHKDLARVADEANEKKTLTNYDLFKWVSGILIGAVLMILSKKAGL